MKDFRVVPNTFAQFLSRGLVIIISLVTTAVLTRRLGVTVYGDYIFISSFILLFVALTDIGTTIIAVRDASAEKSRAATIFGNLFSLRLIFSLLFFGLLNLFGVLLPQFAGIERAVFLGSFILIFLTLRTLAQAILQVFFRLDLGSLLEVAASVLFLVGFWLLFVVCQSRSISSIMLVWSSAALLSGIVGLLLANKYLTIKFVWQKKEISRLIKEALPVGISLLLFSFYDRGIDSFLLKTYSGAQAVGYYGLAYKVHANLTLGAAYLVNSLFPVISSLKNSKDLMVKIYQKYFVLLILVALLLFSFGEIFAPSVVRLLGGTDFKPAESALRILLLATIFSYLNHLNGYFMIALGAQKIYLYYSIIGLFLNLTLNLYFIPRYSFLAAAVITVITEMTMFFLSYSTLGKRYFFSLSYRTFTNNFKALLREKLNYLKI